MLSPRVEVHHGRRDRGLFIAHGLVSGFNYLRPDNSRNNPRVAVSSTDEVVEEPANEVHFFDKYAYLTKLALFSAMIGIIAISIGKQPHCPDGCQKKSCRDSPIDDDDYGGTLQTKSGRCVCHEDDGSEYCAREEQSQFDKVLFYGALTFFGIAFVAFVLKCWLVYYWDADMRVGLDVIETQAVLANSDDSTGRTVETLDGEHISSIELVCPFSALSTESLNRDLLAAAGSGATTRPPKPEIPVIIAVAV